jgi:hypothetical protein
VRSRYCHHLRRGTVRRGTVRRVAGDDDEVDAFLAALGHPDDERAASSARSRSQRRWLRQLAVESSTLSGVLRSLAERGDEVTVACGPWTHRGRLRSVTEALAMVESAEGVALLSVAAVTLVETSAEVTDDRRPESGPDLAGVLAALAPERPAVRLQLRDGTEVAGTLLGLGKDAAQVRLTSSVATVALSALAACVLPERGS